MKILIACEFSGIVREAFLKTGHNAWSCDLLPTEISSNRHIQDDISKHLASGWNMIIAFPPCTYLCSSGARWWKNRQAEQKQAIEFVKKIMDAPVEKIAVENPVGILSTVIRKPDQIIHPWQFGHDASKKTCLWLKNLTALKPTEIILKKDMQIRQNQDRIIYFHLKIDGKTAAGLIRE